MNPGSPTDTGGEATGALLIEAATTTPLGPRILSADEAACRLSGYGRHSLLGSPIGLIYDNRDLPCLLARLPRIAETEEHFWMDRTLIRNRGHRQRVRWTIRAHRGDDGRLAGYFLTMEPLQAESRATLAFGTHSPAAPAGDVPSSEARTMEAATPRTAPRPHLPQPEGPGASAPARGNGTPRQAPQHPSRLGRSPRAEIAESTRSESLAMAAGGVAHDIKNNLHSIKANLALAYKVAPHATELLSHLADAQLALEDAEILARRMLAFTQGETSERCDFDVEGLLDRVVTICTAGTEVRCRVHLSPERLAVRGDRQEIYQIFHNLLTNACDAMPKGGVVDVSVASRRWEVLPKGLELPPGAYTVVSIRDRGCGIPEEQLPLIFQPRFTTKAKGNGFGLACSQDIAKRHGGLITVESQWGVGTEFLVFLPALEPDAKCGGHERGGEAPPTEGKAVERRPGAPSPPERPAGGSYRVLVVEDQLSVAKATCGMLKHLGHRSSVAENGKEALRRYERAKFSDDPFELVLMDMTLPGGLNGGEVFEELRRADPAVRVVAMSGYFEEEDTSALGEREYTGILAKPFSIDALDLVIRAAFNELA